MVHSPKPDSDGFLSHKQILIVLGGLMAGMFLAALDQSVLGVALPRIVSDLGGLNHLSWVVTAYLLTTTASTPLWGKISDLYGRRPTFQAAIVIFILGSTVAALAGSMAVLIAGRAVQGLGGGGLIALALAIVGDVIPPRERGRYQGVRPASRARYWADGSPTARAGGGSSGSISPSVPWRSWSHRWR